MAYAEGTAVPVEKSRAEIERLILKAGASEFASRFDGKHAQIMFVLHGRAVRFLLPLPQADAERFTKYRTRGGWLAARTEEAARREWNQELRRVWRALALIIKAKLEAVESEITTFEHEFLAHFVHADGRTMGDHLIPQLDRFAGGANVGLLLGAGPTQ